MYEKIIHLNDKVIKGSVEETLNKLLKAEAEKLTKAARHERNEQRQEYRSVHCSRNLTTTSGDVTLKVPKFKAVMSPRPPSVNRTKGICIHIEDWRNRPLQGGYYPYVYVDGIYLRRKWEGDFENVAILVAIVVNENGYREVLGTSLRA